MKKINPDLVRLQDILGAISDIEDYKISDLKSKMTLHAVLYNIAIIGEAANKISQTQREKHSEIPWDAIINMRHRIVHDYGNINVQTVQDVLDNDLPVLKKQLLSIMDFLLTEHK